MKLDNAHRAGKIKLLYMAIPFLLVVATSFVYLIFDSRDFIWAVVGGLLIFSFFLIMFYFRFYYITFYAGPDKVRFRYKSLSPFPTQNNSIVIESGKLHSYNISTSYFGIKKEIAFFIKTPGGVASYPKSSIAALSNSEIEGIKKALDLLIKINQSAN